MMPIGKEDPRMSDAIILDKAALDAFLDGLRADDRSEATAAKYGRDLAAFSAWLAGRPADKALMTEYKHVLAASRSPRSVNAALSAMNRFAAWSGRPDWKLGYLRIQRSAFRDDSRDLSRRDYGELVDAAYRTGRERLGLVLETIGSTGMRVSEIGAVTVESLAAGRAVIDLKGKLRTVLLPSRLRGKLRSYAAREGIGSGPVFRTRTGRPLSRQQVWREMKSLCGLSGVARSKAYPHNLRHMFALEFYGSCGDVVKLADVLGHSSVDTTRIYLAQSGREHEKYLESLGLVR